MRSNRDPFQGASLPARRARDLPWTALWALCVAAPSVALAPGCAPAPPAPGSATRTPTARHARPAPGRHVARRTTAYRAGDYVVYAYRVAGKVVTLREQVVERFGQRLLIQVTARRGAEVRTWLQRVTDTEANRRADKPDALFLLRAGAWQRLPNPHDRDAQHLYGWTLPTCRIRIKAPRPRKRSTPTLAVAGTSYACRCSELPARCGTQAVTLSSCDCPRFLWTHASASMTDAAGKPVWSMAVREAGRAPVPPSWVHSVVSCFDGTSEIFRGGRKLATVRAVAQRTVDRASHRILERVIQFDPRPGKPAQRYDVTLAVRGNEFQMRARAFTGTGTLSGDPWWWSGWRSESVLPNKLRVVSQDALHAGVLHVSKKMLSPGGAPIMTFRERLRLVAPAVCEKLLAASPHAPPAPAPRQRAAH